MFQLHPTHALHRCALSFALYQAEEFPSTWLSWTKNKGNQHQSFTNNILFVPLRYIFSQRLEYGSLDCLDNSGSLILEFEVINTVAIKCGGSYDVNLAVLNLFPCSIALANVIGSIYVTQHHYGQLNLFGRTSNLSNIFSSNACSFGFKYLRLIYCRFCCCRLFRSGSQNFWAPSIWSWKHLRENVLENAPSVEFASIYNIRLADWLREIDDNSVNIEVINARPTYIPCDDLIKLRLKIFNIKAFSSVYDDFFDKLHNRARYAGKLAACSYIIFWTATAERNSAFCDRS